MTVLVYVVVEGQRRGLVDDMRDTTTLLTAQAGERMKGPA
jgi:hypothetical protein